MNSRDLERMLSIFWLSLFRWRCSKCSFGWMNFREDEKNMRELFFLGFWLERGESRKLAGLGVFFVDSLKCSLQNVEKAGEENQEKKTDKKNSSLGFLFYFIVFFYSFSVLFLLIYFGSFGLCTSLFLSNFLLLLL